MAESSPSSSSKTAAAEEEAANDLLATQEILQGLKDGLTRRRAATYQDKIPLTPKTRDELLQESFPMIPTSSSKDEDSDVKPDLTTEECIALRIGLRNTIHSDVKRKMSLLQEQLSEYHTVLEDVIAYKSKCEELEQDKQDLARICRETCKVRDDRIELLEKEVRQLQRLNEEQQQQLRLLPCICSVISSRNDSSTSHDERSAQGGQPGPQAYPDFNHQQHLYHRTQSGMLTMVNNSYHSSYHQPFTTMEPSRRVSLTPPAAAVMATTNSHDNNNMAIDPNCTTRFDIAAIQPLPFQRRRLPPSSSHHDDYSSRYYGCNKKSRPS